jgi:hypothetical protein
VFPVKSSLDRATYLELLTLRGKMSLFRQTGVTVLLLLLVFAPVIACASPNAPLTPAEQAYCHVMHFQCGQMTMSKSHGCYDNPTSLYEGAFSGNAVALHSVLIPPVALHAVDLLRPAPAIPMWVKHSDYIPPKPRSDFPHSENLATLSLGIFRRRLHLRVPCTNVFAQPQSRT